MSPGIEDRHRPIRIGVPSPPSPLVPREAASRLLDDALARRIPAVVHAPRGYGKTVAVAAWLAAHPGLDAVWVRGPVGTRSWSETADRVGGALEDAGLGEPAPAGPRGWERLLRVADRLREPVVVVIEGIDALGARLLADGLQRVAERVPRLRIVLVTRELHPRFGDAPARVALVSATALAWDPGEVRVLAAAGLPAAVLERCAEYSGGRAEAVLHGALTWARQLERLPASARADAEQLMVDWHLERIAELGGAEAAAFALVVADLLELPESSLEAVASRFGGIDAEVARRLASGGYLAWRSSVFTGESALVAPAPLREAYARAARAREDTRRREAHRVLVRRRDYAQQAPTIHAYHRTCAGDPEAAIAILRHGTLAGRTVDPGMMGAMAREVPVAALGGDPALIAARVAFDNSFPDGETVREASRVLMSLPRRTAQALEPARRLLVEGAQAQTLLLRGDASEAARRATRTTEHWFPRRLELGRNGRRTLAYTMATAAEAYALRLRPDLALDAARRLLTLPPGDRWPLTSFRAHAAAAFGHAFNGEHEAMTGARREARLYLAISGSPGSVLPVYLWAAEMRDAWGRFDGEALAAVADRFRTVEERDGAWLGAGDVLEAAAAFALGDVERAQRRIDAVLAAPPVVPSHPFRGFSLVVGANAALAAQRPGYALSLVEGLVSPPRHAICFEALRAAALLALGRPWEALRATEECVRPEERHSLGTLPLVHLLRAAAHLELHHDNAARESFADALRLTEAAWLPGLFAMLSPELLGRLTELHPPASEAVAAELRSAVRAAGSAVPGRATLSEREVELLALLREGYPIAEIARLRFVSLNTVKTQLRSLYRKLGVTNRHGAVDYAYQVRLPASQPVEIRPRTRRRGPRGDSRGE